VLLRRILPAILCLSAACVAQQNPSLATYQAELLAGYAASSATAVGLPRHPVALDLHLVATDLNYYEFDGSCNPALTPPTSNACTFNNPVAMIAYWHAITRGGVSSVSSGPVLSPFIASAEYAAYCNPSTMTCLPPTSYETAGLANYDALWTAMASAGVALALAPTVDSVVTAGCSIYNANEAAIQKCVVPLLVAMAQHIQNIINIARFTLYHEPTGELPRLWGTILSAADFATLVAATAAAVYAVLPAVAMGVADIGGEAAYITAWSTTPHLSFGALDAYGGTCDVSEYTTSILPAYLNEEAIIVGAGLIPRINETARPRWCALAGGANESDAYMGGGDELWGSVQTATLTAAGETATGADDAWWNFFMDFCSVHGFASISIYPSEPTIWYCPTDPTGVDDNCTNGPYTKNLMGHLSGNTETGLWHARTNTGWSAGVRGNAGFTGYAGVEQ
jgi:hypothetical protein